MPLFPQLQCLFSLLQAAPWLPEGRAWARLLPGWSPAQASALYTVGPQKASGMDKDKCHAWGPEAYLIH